MRGVTASVAILTRIGVIRVRGQAKTSSGDDFLCGWVVREGRGHGGGVGVGGRVWSGGGVSMPIPNWEFCKLPLSNTSIFNPRLSICNVRLHSRF